MELLKIPRAVVTDLDGTIVREDGSVGTATVDAAVELARQGIPLVAATARTPAGVLTLETLHPYLTMAVCCTGAIGWSPATGRVIWQDNIAAVTVAQIVGLAGVHLSGAGVAAFDGRSWALTDRYVAARGRRPRGDSKVLSADKIADRPACAMSICHPDLDADELTEILRAAGLAAAQATLTYATPQLLDIAPAGIDKFTAPAAP